MEYVILIGVIVLALIVYKIKSLFSKATDLKLIKQDQQLTDKANNLKNDIKELNKKLDTAYRPDMTPEEIEKFWRGK